VFVCLLINHILVLVFIQQVFDQDTSYLGGIKFMREGYIKCGPTLLGPKVKVTEGHQFCSKKKITYFDSQVRNLQLYTKQHCLKDLKGNVDLCPQVKGHRGHWKVTKHKKAQLFN
jgi:hypothetical protein